MTRKQLELKKKALMEEQNKKPGTLGMGNPLRKEARARIPLRTKKEQREFDEISREEAAPGYAYEPKSKAVRKRDPGEPGINHFAHPRLN